MEQHRLGGQRGLDRLLRVERAEQVHRGDLAAEFFVRGVGAGGREGVDEGVQGVVGEDLLKPDCTLFGRDVRCLLPQTMQHGSAKSAVHGSLVAASSPCLAFEPLDHILVEPQGQ